MKHGKEGPLISIILPIYNVGQYLQRCLDSILKQTYQNLEIILIDDGSTDGCSDICDDYQKCDDRFVVIHKENGGVSSARNEGLRIMRGEYITFIDPDDIVGIDYVEILYQAILNTSCDISICGVKTIYSEKKCQTDKHNRSITTFTNKQALEKMLYQNEIDVSVWGKMYRASLFENIFFPIGKINEDTAVTYKLFARADRITFDSYKCYFYVQHENSIMHQQFSRKKMSLIEFSEECLNDIKESFPDIVGAAICKHVTDCFVLICKIYECHPLDRECLRRCLSIIKKYRKHVIMDSKARNKTKLACFISYFGPRLVYIINCLNAYKDEIRGARNI